MWMFEHYREDQVYERRARFHTKAIPQVKARREIRSICRNFRRLQPASGIYIFLAI